MVRPRSEWLVHAERMLSPHLGRCRFRRKATLLDRSGEASGAGAREAAVQPSNDAVEQAVRHAALGLAAERLSVNVAWGGTRGSPVTVSVAYEAPVASLLAGWLLPGSVSLSASATMRQEFA
jgi:hypothetical protein